MSCQLFVSAGGIEPGISSYQLYVDPLSHSGEVWKLEVRNSYLSCSTVTWLYIDGLNTHNHQYQLWLSGKSMAFRGKGIRFKSCWFWHFLKHSFSLHNPLFRLFWPVFALFEYICLGKKYFFAPFLAHFGRGKGRWKTQIHFTHFYWG